MGLKEEGFLGELWNLGQRCVDKARVVSRSPERMDPSVTLFFLILSTSLRRVLGSPPLTPPPLSKGMGWMGMCY